MLVQKKTMDMALECYENIKECKNPRMSRRSSILRGKLRQHRHTSQRKQGRNINTECWSSTRADQPWIGGSAENPVFFIFKFRIIYRPIFINGCLTFHLPWMCLNILGEEFSFWRKILCWNFYGLLECKNQTLASSLE